MIWIILGIIWLTGMIWLAWELAHAPERPDWDPEYWEALAREKAEKKKRGGL